MDIMAVALGGCLSGDPCFGLTEDTGGHITYVLGAMRALSERADVGSAEIVTRRFENRQLGSVYAQPHEILSAKLRITRIDSGNRAYLAKEALARDRAAFTGALIADLRSRPRLPDIIHAHFADAAQVALAVRDAVGIPFIYTAHSLGIDKARTLDRGDKGLALRIDEERQAMAAADAVIGSSRDECERQVPAYGADIEGKVHRVVPGIDQRQASAQDIAAASALIAPFLRDSGKPLVLAIARPVAKKNLGALVEAFAIGALRHHANLVILPGLRRSIEEGEPEQVQVMRALIDAVDTHDLHGSVAYPRRHDSAAVRGLYALAARSGGVFVNPALIEPFGLTILEAAVHGLPVVATCRGGPVDIVGDLDHGLLVDPVSPSAIASAIERLLQDRPLWRRCSANGRNNVENVRWSAYAADFHAVASSLLSPARSTVAQRPAERLLLCDIDNTLTGCAASARRFAHFIESRPDICFGVATGRSLVEARRIMRAWHLPEPAMWVTSVGSEIYWQRAMSGSRDADYAAAIGADWAPEKLRAIASGIAGLTPQPSIEQRAFKLSYFADRAAADRLRTAIADAALPARVIFSHGRLLDILPAKAGKAAAMRHVARTLGIASGRVMAAGDSGNDLDMIADCRNAVIVANAEADLLALAGRDHVYLSRQPHAAGVLEGLRHMLRGSDEPPRRMPSARLDRAA